MICTSRTKVTEVDFGELNQIIDSSPQVTLIIFLMLGPPSQAKLMDIPPIAQANMNLTTTIPALLCRR